MSTATAPVPAGSPAAVVIQHRQREAESKLLPEYRKLVARLAAGDKLSEAQVSKVSILLAELGLTPNDLNRDCEVFAEVQGLAPTAKHADENVARLEAETVAAGEAVKVAMAAVPLARGKHAQLANEASQLRIARLRWRELQKQNPRLYDSLPSR